MLKNLKKRSKELKKETFILYLVYKDSRIPWWKRAFLAIIIGYAFSPIDLIPDFIPLLGYLDDLVIVPIGIFIAIKLIPSEIIDEWRKKAQDQNINIPVGKKTAVIIVGVWGLGLLLITIYAIKFIEFLFVDF